MAEIDSINGLNSMTASMEIEQVRFAVGQVSNIHSHQNF